MPLSPGQRRALKARAHHLKPVVQLGDKGLTEAVLAEIERALHDHELIKLRMRGADREQRGELAAAICARTGAEAVTGIGAVLVLYRPNPEAGPQAGSR